MGSYGPTPTAPVTTEGYMVKTESRMLLGKTALYGSLDVTTLSYTTYTISVGIATGQSWELGFLESVGFSYVPTWESVDSANVATGTVYDMTSEEFTITAGLREFKPQVLEAALGSGVMYTLGTEVLYAFGGGCSLVNRPIAIEFTNQACNLPAVANAVTSGITGGILTGYDMVCSSGIPWDAMVRNELNLLSLEWKGRPVNARTKSQRLGLTFGPIKWRHLMQTLNIGGHPEVGNAEAQPEREGCRDYQGASLVDDGIVRTADNLTRNCRAERKRLRPRIPGVTHLQSGSTRAYVN